MTEGENNLQPDLDQEIKPDDRYDSEGNIIFDYSREPDGSSTTDGEGEVEVVIDHFNLPAEEGAAAVEDVEQNIAAETPLSQKDTYFEILRDYGGDELVSRSEILRSVCVKALNERGSYTGEEWQAHLRDILLAEINAISETPGINDEVVNDGQAASAEVVTPSDNTPTPSEFEQALFVSGKHFEHAQDNTESLGFRVANSLTWGREALGHLRNGLLGIPAKIFGRKVAESSISKKSEKAARIAGAVVTAGGTIGAGIAARNIFGFMPVLGGVAAGFTTQRAFYRLWMNHDLKNFEYSSPTFVLTACANWLKNTFSPERDSDGKKPGNMVTRALSLNYVFNKTMEDRLINEEHIYKLGNEINRDGDGTGKLMGRVERYAAVLQNSVDERRASGQIVTKDDPEYRALLAALQIMCDCAATTDKAEYSAAMTQRSKENFNYVGRGRTKVMLGSAALAVPFGLFAGQVLMLKQAARDAAAAAKQAAEEAKNGASAAGAATTAGSVGAGTTVPAPVEAPVPAPGPAPVEAPRVHESLTDHIHSATKRIFGITQENVDSVDSAHAEHLVRAQILHDLNIGHEDASGQILFSAEDKSWLTDHGIVFNTDGNLDFSQAHGLVADGKDLTTVINDHLQQWEQASDPMAVTPLAPELTEVVRNMQFTQLDHELMLTVSRDYKLDLAELRELRWEPGSDVSKLFADHKLAWQNLMKEQQLHVGDKLLKLSDAQGVNPIEKTRWIMRQWLESKKVSGLQLGQVVAERATEEVAEPERHWFFGTPVEPATDRVVPNANPVSQPVPHVPAAGPEHTAGVVGQHDAAVAHNGAEAYPATDSNPREALPKGNRVEVDKLEQPSLPKAKVNVVESEGRAATIGRATTTPLRPNMTGEVAKPNLAEPRGGLNPLSTPNAPVEHPNSLERILFGKSAPEAGAQPLPAITDRVPATVEGPSVDADDTSKIPSLQESD